MAVHRHRLPFLYSQEPSSNFMDGSRPVHVSQSNSRWEREDPRTTYEALDQHPTNNGDSTSLECRKRRVRIAEVDDSVVVERCISRARNGVPRDSEYTTEVPGVQVNLRKFSGYSTSLQTCRSLTVEGEDRSSHAAYLMRAPTPPTLEQGPRAADLDCIGSWCRSDTLNEDRRRDNFLHQVMPMTPRPQKIPSPDLAPLSMDYVFCPCCEEEDCAGCGKEEDRVNKIWYLYDRAKMDSQRE